MRVLLTALLLVLGSGAIAQTNPNPPEENGTPDMEVTLTLEQKTSAGLPLSEPLTAATTITVAPGDTYAYHLLCKNVGSQPARDFIVSIPILEDEEYLADSATADSAIVSFSLDGGATFHYPPITYTAQLPDGTLQERIAPASMYTSIRWLFTGMIDPEEVRTASFEVMRK